MPDTGSINDLANDYGFLKWHIVGLVTKVGVIRHLVTLYDDVVLE